MKSVECIPKMRDEEDGMYAQMRDEDYGMYAHNEG